MHPSTQRFLALLAPAIKTGAVDECLHCTVSGTGPLANAAGIDGQSIPRVDTETVLEELKLLATNPASQAEITSTYHFHLFWMFDSVYLLSSTNTPDFPHALRRMACRVEWGELWKRGRCPEPPLKPYPEALAYLREHLPGHPEWHESALYPLLASNADLR